MPSEPPADFLKIESLEWARKHIEHYGDSDMLPRLFEYDAIKFAWQVLLPDLAKYDIARFESRAFHTFLLPKEKGGYRVALRLDPLDAILYTAAVYEAAPFIEKARVPRARSIACSYRIDIGPDGRFFPQDNGYGLFAKRARDFGDEHPEGYILSADIADFYNHINIHRIANALESAGVTANRAEAIQRMLLSWTGKQSRGIPAGPSASNVLAEACLADVDEKLLRENFKHARYADDFRIFCRSRAHADEALHALSEFLFVSHGLSLATHKTEIFLASEVAKRADDPAWRERKQKAARVAKAADEARERREKGAQDAALRREVEAAQRRIDDPVAAALEHENLELDSWLEDWLNLPGADYPIDDSDDEDGAEPADDDEDADEGAVQPVLAVAVTPSVVGFVAVPPTMAIDEPNDEEQTKATLLELFTGDLKQEVIQLGSVRHNFRRAVLLEVDSLHELTLANLGGKLLPALRDAVLYLQRTTKKPDRRKVARALIDLAKAPHVRFLPWAQEWLLFALTTSFFDCAPRAIEKLATQAKEHHQIGQRARALVAKASKDETWVREHRRLWNSMPAWDKRALIWAGSVLTSGELPSWRKQIGSTDPLDRAVALHALRPTPSPQPPSVKRSPPNAPVAPAATPGTPPAKPSGA